MHDPLLSGFFSTANAAHLLGVAQPTLRGWLNGYRGSSAGPVIDRDFVGTKAVSFLDLMELRFIAFFRAQDVKMTTLRKAAAAARDAWNVSHPLALSNERYFTDRRTVFAKTADELGDERAWDLASGQTEMWVTIENTIAKGVVFDPVSHLAKLWMPRPGEFPDVIIDPRVAFGKPFVKGTGVPTRVLFEQWRAEGQKSKVASWFNVPEQAVDTAVAYELVAA